MLNVWTVVLLPFMFMKEEILAKFFFILSEEAAVATTLFLLLFKVAIKEVRHNLAVPLSGQVYFLSKEYYQQILQKINLQTGLNSL
jgi:hypothetical protein